MNALVHITPGRPAASMAVDSSITLIAPHGGGVFYIGPGFSSMGRRPAPNRYWLNTDIIDGPFVCLQGTDLVLDGRRQLYLLTARRAPTSPPVTPYETDLRMCRQKQVEEIPPTFRRELSHVRYGDVLVDIQGRFWVYTSYPDSEAYQIQVDTTGLPPTRDVAWGVTHNTVYCLGEDGVVRHRSSFEYGCTAKALPALLPVPVPIRRIYSEHGLLLLGEDGSLYSIYSTYTDQLPFPAPVHEMTGGGWGTCALTETGDVFTWHKERSRYIESQLQQGRSIDLARLKPPLHRLTPVPIATIASNGHLFLALSHDDRLFATGDMSLFRGWNVARYADDFVELVDWDVEKR